MGLARHYAFGLFSAPVLDFKCGLESRFVVGACGCVGFLGVV